MSNLEQVDLRGEDGDLQVASWSATPAAAPTSPQTFWTTRNKVIIAAVVAAIVVLIVVIVPAVVLTHKSKIASSDSNLPTPSPEPTFNPPDIPTVAPSKEVDVVIEGSFLEGYLGWSVCSLNVNNDNYQDVLIGGLGGYAQIVLGYNVPLSNPPTLKPAFKDGQAGWSFETGNAYDNLGYSVASTDINADGFSDVLIAGITYGNQSEGAVFAIYGHAPPYTSPTQLTNMSSSVGFIIDGPSSLSYAGKGLAGGDVNGDGYGDIVIGASNATGQNGKLYPGAVYIVFGSSTQNPSVIQLAQLATSGLGVIIYGEEDGDEFGFSIAIAGDVNGDSDGDIIIGAIGANAGSGAVYVIGGRSTSTWPSSAVVVSALTNFYKIAGTNYETLGYDVASLGDMNGDSIPDFVVGAIGDNEMAPKLPGTAYVIFGRSTYVGGTITTTEFDGTNGFALKGLRANDAFGFSVSSAGDYNLDGISDLIVGAPYSSINAVKNPYGLAFLFYGHKGTYLPLFNVSDFAAPDGQIFEGTIQDDGFGWAVGGGFDFNGDQRSDFILTAPFRSVNNVFSAGISVLLFNQEPSKK